MADEKKKKDLSFTSFGSEAYAPSEEDLKEADEWVKDFQKKGLISDDKDWKPLKASWDTDDKGKKKK